ncbi:5'-3' exonuclease H3TH domain-containing protein [Patescibacteria group bacterium]
MSGKLVIIDGNAIMHRAFHAMPPLTTPRGEPIGAVQGFMNMLVRIIENLTPTHLAVCFDRKEKTFRSKLYKKYQSHRPPTDSDLSSQFAKIQKLLKSANVNTFDKAGYEADDLIGTLSKKSKIEVVIVTGDKDQMQLVSSRVKLFVPIRGLSNAQLYSEKEVKEKLGVKPPQVIDLKALMGDPSDNYPGVYGIGPKTAVSLLDKYGTYKNVYKHLDDISESTKQKLISGKEGGDISYELAKIITDVDFEYDFKDLDDWDLVSDKALKTYEKFGMRSLPKRLQKISSESINYKKNLSEENIVDVAKVLVKKLPKGKWAIRGTASLVLQGLDMVADDVDVVCDKSTAQTAQKKLGKYQVRKIAFSKDKKFQSHFGAFNIDNTMVEVYGGWQINGDKGWSKVFDGKGEQQITIVARGEEIPVTTVDTELEMFATMGRWNAFHKIKKLIGEKNQQQLF